jgi:HEAT repeats
LVVEIHQALTTKQRLAMLRHVHQVISSSNSTAASSSGNNNNIRISNVKHDSSSFFLWLLEAGTLDALILQLNFVLHRRHGGTIAQEVVDLCRVLALFLRNCPPHQASHVALNILSSSSSSSRQQQQQQHAAEQQHPRGRAMAASRAGTGTGTSDFMQLLSHAYQQWPAAQLHVLAILHAVSGREKGTELVLQSRDILLRVVDSLQNTCRSQEENEQQQNHHHHHHHHSHQQQQRYNSTNNSNNNDSTTNNNNALLQTLGLIKNISYFQKDSWSILVQIPGFLKALTSLTLQQQNHHQSPGQRILLVDCGKSRERLSAIWRNFAVAQSSSGGGGRRGGGTSLLTQHAAVVSSICSLAMNHPSNNCKHEEVSNTNNDDDDVAVYRNFLTILVSVSMDVESSLLLMLHGDGILPNHILQRLLLQSTDQVVRKRAARTIRQWASHESTGSLLVHCPGLLHTISQVAHQDESPEVRHEAVEALSRCAAWISAPMPQQQAVLDALACLCQVSSSVSVIARALKGQAALVNNRLLLVSSSSSSSSSNQHSYRTPNIFVHALTNIALQSSSPSIARADACCALCDLAAEEGNRRRLLVLKSDERDDESEVNHQLLEALRVNALSSIPGGRRDYAAQALVYLAENSVDNRTILAQHSQLLQALIQYAATSDNSTIIKHHVKRVILQIVQEL